MTQALLHQLQLPVGAAEDGDVRESPHCPLVAQGLGLQHVHPAGHTADLLGEKHPSEKASGLLTIRTAGPEGRWGRRRRQPPGFFSITGAAASSTSGVER